MREKVVFLNSSGHFACALSAQKEHIVIVFPELKKLLFSPLFEEALPILAHELGHIVYGHSERQIAPIVAQLEADYFAVQMGLKKELLKFLRSQKASDETRLRIEYLLQDYEQRKIS